MYEYKRLIWFFLTALVCVGLILTAIKLRGLLFG